MRNSFPLYVFIALFACNTPQYEENERVTIYRDQWGVPHIHGQTDQDLAYGLAWASCEDDFNTIQEQMLALKGRLGTVKGKDGLVADFAIKFMGILEYARSNYREMLSPEVVRMIEGYQAGINNYAALHKADLLSDNLFPLQAEDLVAGYMLGLVEISGASADLQRIMNGEIVHQVNSNFPRGSNAIAVSGEISNTGETFLAINSHQPMEGWYSWYEAHLMSDEGMNILGGTFPGGITIFHGVNEFLGWAHTVNYADFSDVFKLSMHPEKKLTYRVDGEWKKLERTHHWAWMKLWGPIRIPIRRTVYKSIFGSTFKTDDGFFAWRFVAGEAVLAIEQWYKMNRATNLRSFKEALSIMGIPCTNIVYADREDNLLYISNGKFPLRNGSYDWKQVVPGDRRDVLWSGYWPLDSLPQVQNPASGFVFNTNNTPFSSTDPSDNPAPSRRHEDMGFQNSRSENNRSLRLLALMKDVDTLSYEDFKKIKFDLQYPDSLSQPAITNLELLLQLDEQIHTELSAEIGILKSWNRRTEASNEEAALFILARKELLDLLSLKKPPGSLHTVTEAQCVEALSKAGAIMRKKFGAMRIPLGEIQRHRRGSIDLPLGGGPDVLAAIYSSEDGDGRLKAKSGESYILLARFKSGDLPQLESVHAYGSSANPGSPHFTDQMNLFANQRLKKMSLSLNDVKKVSIKTYHPLMICH